MKKFYLLFLLMLLPQMASADDSGSCGENVTWTYVEESQKLIISGSGPMEDYVNEISLPISSGSYASNKVPWKSYIEKIQVVEINEGVTTIGAGAFSSIKTLASVTIPNSITSIGGGAFYGPSYKDLNSVTIPSSVTSIGTYAFLRGLSSINVDEGNQAFTSVDGVLFNKDMSKLIAYPANKEDASYIIPNSVTVIENGAFSRAKCTSLTIPNSVTTIGESAFYSTSISSYMIPSSVSSIGVEAFDLARCSSIDVEDGNLQYTSNDGVLFNKDMTTLIYYPCKKPGESYTIPNSVTTIDIDAFHASYNLTSVTIPNSVTSIGERAFFDCNKLASLDIPSSVTSIGRSAFRECDVLTSMIIPDHVPVINFSILSLCKSLTTVTLGSGVTSIGNSIFANSENLKDVYCHAVDVPQTNSSTFKDTPIENITLHVPAASLETYKATEPWSKFGTILPIGDSPAVQAEPYAVLSEDNTVLTFYYDGNKVERNGMDIVPIENVYMSDFAWSDHRENITTAVFDPSFANCTSITSTAWWFFNCKKMASITGIEYLRTDNVTDMQSMFEDCSSLTSLDVSGFNTGNVINMHLMFSGCSKLTSLDISNFKTDNAITLEGLFYGCSGLKSVNVNGLKTDKVTSMSWLFVNCSSLTSLDVSSLNTSNVTEMRGMFSGCSSLTSLDISGFNTANVTTMRELFYKCANLKTITVGEGWTTQNANLGDHMFTNCINLVGGAGTVYDANHDDKAYAHIDGGSSNPGYFTFKEGGESPAEETEETIKITSAGQTTWCSAYDLDFTNVVGLKAYTATGYNRTTGTIWLTRVQEVPAKEGILLMGDPGEYKVPHKSTTTYYMNMFKGTLEDITINETEGEYTNYYLSNGDSGVGFYKVNGSIGIKANRAYLPLLKGTTQAGTRFIGLGFEDDGTTNLTPALSKGEGEVEWFTLQGQRVAKPGKGLYIKNGKKVIVR